MENKKTPKRLIFNIDPELHETVKKRARKRRYTLREWVLMAIMEKMHREQIDEI